MRNRIAVWGRDAQEKRVLLAIELQVHDNIVTIQIFPEKLVTDEIYQRFMDQWRKGQEAELPEPDRVVARELSVTEGLLPDDLKAEQTDMILRAQTEWHFHVLSAKLAETYKAELAEIEDRIERAGEYSSDLWNQAKNFWQKVQGQLQDKTLLHEQGNDIRKRVDATFDTLKKMREQLNERYQEESTKQVAAFNELLQKAEASIQEGTHLHKVFNELRDIQRKFHGVKFTKKDRDAVYSRIDAAFKAVKAKRGQGEASGDGSALSRTESRLQGLNKAIDRMQKSIKRDHDDLKFERRRIERTDGQLEKQIREAKVVMIESRISSKQLKLNDMEQTRGKLEKRIEQDKKRAEKRARKDAERAAAAAAKAKIASEIGRRSVSPEEAARLQAAAAAISGGKSTQRPLTETTPQVATFVAYSEIISPEVPPVAQATGGTKATGPASPEKAPQPTPAEKVGDAVAGAILTAGEVIEPLRAEGGLVDQITEVVDNAVDSVDTTITDITDTVKAVAQVAGQRLSGETTASEVTQVTEEE